MPDAIARFEAAYTARVGTVPAPPADPRPVRSVEQLIAPLRLPDALRRWWERFAPATLPMGPDQGLHGRPFEPEFLDPAYVYYRWQAARDRPGRIPEALLPVSAWGDTVRFVDLTDGAMYLWTFGTPFARPWAGGVEEWIDLVTAALRDEASRVLELGEGARWVVLRMPEIEPPGRPVDLRDPGAWPDAWRDASRLFDGRRAVTEREASISELQWAGSGAGTVCGWVSRTTSTADGSRLRVLDGTGWLDAWCPADVPGRWLVRDPGLCELDVTVDPEPVVTAVRLRSYG